MKKSKGFANIAVIILVVIIAAALGYFALKSSKSVPGGYSNSKILSHITPRDMAKESGTFFRFSYPEGFEVAESGHVTPGGPGGQPNPHLLIQKSGNTNKNETITLDGLGYLGGSGIEVKERICANYANPSDRCERVKNSDYLLITKSKDPAILSAFDSIFSTLEVKSYGSYTDEKDPVDSNPSDGSRFISGIVIDKSTKQPLKDVEITVKARPIKIVNGMPSLGDTDQAFKEGLLIGVVKTDADGRYQIKVPLGKGEISWAGDVNRYNIFLIEVKKGGYEYENVAYGMIDVKDGQTLRLDFDLSLATPKG